MPQAALHERVPLDPMPVEGHVTIQLFDALTGKLVEEQSGKNFLSRALTEKLQRFAQRYVFGHQHPSQADAASWGGFNPTFGTDGFFRWMILTDSGLAESPTTEHIVPGAILGYSDRFPHSDTDLRRGTINRAESWHTPAQTRWVMDWATDRGNGTIQSVCWAVGQLGDSPLPETLGIGLAPSTLDWRSGLPSHVLAGFYEGDYWVIGPDTTVRRLAAGSGATAWTRLLPAPAPAVTQNMLAVRGDQIWYVSGAWGNQGLIRHTISTNTNFNVGAVHWGARIAIIGNIAYLTPSTTAHAAGSTLTFQRYDTVAGVWLADLNIPNLPANVSSLNIFHAGGNLLRIGGDGVNATRYHDVDVVAGTITPVGFPVMPAVYVLGHGGRLKVWVMSRSTVYTSTVMRPTDGLLYDVSDMRGQYLLSRIRVAAPIVKDSTRTMKVIYDFNYL